MKTRPMSVGHISRRTALQATLATGLSAATVSLSALHAFAQQPRRSANSELRIGVIGVGVRGKYLIGNLPEAARVTAICDCAKSRIASALAPKGNFASVLQAFRDRDAPRCATYQDYRQMLDREKLDAVVIATPDHHHALAAMLALRAGLDVYLEKPLTLTIREGRLLADMVQRTGRVLQVGSQQRSMEVNRFACEFIRSGGLGKISKVELPNYPGPMTIPRLPNSSAPPEVDWEMFLGPAPRQPYARQLWIKDEYHVGELLWRGWDLYRDYSGHIMTNWGAHSVDMVQYALGRDRSGPSEIVATEPESVDIFGQMWNQKTPLPGKESHRFWPVRMRYDDGVELHFAHGPEFIRFHGERGTLKMRRNYFETDPPGLAVGGPDAVTAAKWNGAGHVARPHLQNWLDAIRDGATLNAPVESGHRTVSICHLANIARELQRPLRWNPISETFIDDAAADMLLERPRRAGFELPA
ncbi:MAG: Gfo/Idh/MocA family oxidoreductase [Planctomycetales bacterium]|nr:Gfo/Idh/MocA family oxidoreductase [Planctomycetales bacterium]